MLVILILILIGLFGFGAAAETEVEPVEATLATPASVTDALGWDCYEQGLGYVVTHDGASGVIVPATQAYQWFGGIVGEVKGFTPADEEILALENALSAEQPGLESYTRRYVGVEVDGERRILVDGENQGDRLDGSTAAGCVEVEPVAFVTLDGGDLLFEAVYLPESGELESFSFHGDA